MKQRSEASEVTTIVESLIINAKSGSVEAQRELGKIYFNDQTLCDYEQSFYWYMEAAKRDDAFSQYEVGYMYKNGYGVEKSDYEAVKWYKESAKNGDEAAQDALRRYEEEQMRKTAEESSSSTSTSKPSGSDLRGVSTGDNTSRLFEIVAKASRTGLSDELAETPYDRVTDRRIPKRVSGFSVSISRKQISQSLVKFTSTDTSELEMGRLSKQSILAAKGLGERDSPDIPYDANKPIILVQSTDNGKPAWWYVHCSSRANADALKKICAAGTEDTIPLDTYGEIVSNGWGTEPPPKYNDWYKWNEAYFQTLLDCETCLAHGATFEKDGQHVIEEAAKRNNTELFYYLLMQTWDKAGYDGVVDLETTKHINPESPPASLKQALSTLMQAWDKVCCYGTMDLAETKQINPESLPDSLKNALSMSLFWAVQYGNPVMADVALHYGADSNFASPFHGVTPMELAVYYGNDMIMDIMEERDSSVKHRLAAMRRGTPQTPAIDRYYQEKAAYVTENIEPDPTRKRDTFLKLFHRLKRNDFIHADIRKYLYDQTGNISFILDRGQDNEKFIVGKKHNPVDSFKEALDRGDRVTITVPKELMRQANLTSEQYSQLLKEITAGALLGQTAGVNLPGSEDEYSTLQVRLPCSFIDTLAGQIAIDADYLMKTICHIPSTYFPLELQLGALEKLEQEGLFAQSSLVSDNPEFALQIYRRSGAHVLTDYPDLKQLVFRIEENQLKDKEIISRRVDPSWVAREDEGRFMFDGEGGVLVYNPITRQVSVDLQSVARSYIDYRDKDGIKHPQTINPLQQSCMWEFNQVLPEHPYTAHKIARLDLVYQLTAIVLAFIEQGRVPSFENFHALQSPGLYETPFLLPPLLHLHQQGIHGSPFAHLFGGVGELGNLGSSENRGTYQPKSQRYTGLSSYGAGQGSLGEMASRPIVTQPGERIGYHATRPEFAESILREGFRQGIQPGRLGTGTYVSSTPEGALAEFYSIPVNQGQDAAVLRTVYRPGVEARTDRAPAKKYGYEINNEEYKEVAPGLGPLPEYRANMPFSYVDSISAPSAREPESRNTNVLDSKKVKPVDKQGFYPTQDSGKGKY